MRPRLQVLDPTPPSAAGDFVNAIGYAESATTIFVNPHHANPTAIASGGQVSTHSVAGFHASRPYPTAGRADGDAGRFHPIAGFNGSRPLA